MKTKKIILIITALLMLAGYSFSQVLWTPGAIVGNNTTNQYVGIGTATPNTLLHLYSTSTPILTIERSNANGYGGALCFLSSNPPTAANCYIGWIYFQAKFSGTAQTGAEIVANSTAAWGANSYNTRLDFETNSGNSLATKMTILDNGNVGIATMTPSTKLEVDGTNGTTLKIVDGNQGLGNILMSDANGVANWHTASAVAWSITGNSGTNPPTNFLGTTDGKPLIFKVNNQISGLIDYLYYGYGNTYFGYQAGNYNNSIGESNVAIGYNALASIDASGTDNANTAVGNTALKSNTSGGGNTAVGDETLLYNQDGGLNTAIGDAALQENVHGFYNTACGHWALFHNANSLYSGGNTAYGYYALYTNTSGTYNTSIGYQADVYSGALTDAAAIGYNATTNANDKIVIGTSSNTNLTGGYGAWQNNSDGRFKLNIIENVPGLAFIIKLRPVTFNLNAKKLDEFLGIKQRMDTTKDIAAQNRYYQRLNEVSLMKQTGFIAQEVEATAKSLGYDFDGVHVPGDSSTDNYTVGYATFVVPLVKAVQEQQEMIDSLKQRQKTTDSLNAIQIAKQNAIINSLLNHQKTSDSLIAVALNCCVTGVTHKAIQNNDNEQGNEASIHNIELANNAVLYQNAPNPFGEGTTIKYFIPENADAQIIFFDDFGNKIKEYKIGDKGMGQLNVSSTNLAAGMYSYSLYVNGKIIDTKKMVKQ
jgi:hypothetical protein